MAEKNSIREDERKTWYNRWSNTEILLGVALIAVITYFVYFQTHGSYSKKTLPCSDPSYLQSITEINDFVDRSVDPCEDFHQFSCGTFFRNVYKDEVESRLVKERILMDNELKSYITDPIYEDDSHAIVVQKHFFQACFNVDHIDADNDRTFLQLLEVVGGWPVLKGNKWDEEKFDWIDAIIKCKNLGLPFHWFLKFSVQKSDQNYLKISHPVVTENWDGFLKEIVANIVVHMSGSKSEGVLTAKKIVEFEKQLRLASQTSERLSILEIKDLQKTYPKLNWLTFLNNLTEESSDLTPETEVVFAAENYISRLDNLLVQTDKRTQANYIIWKIIEEFGPFLSKPIRAVFEFYMDGKFRSINRLDYCISKTKEKFPYLSETEYIRKYSTEKARVSAKELVEAVKNEFLNRVSLLEWFNQTTGETYLEQYRQTEIDIGGQDVIFEEQVFDDHYLHIGNFNITSETPNIIELLSERQHSYYQSMFSIIGFNATETEIAVLYPMILSVFYNNEQNRLVVPPALLQGVFFNPNKPSYLNFASLGSSVASRLIKDLRFFTSNDENVVDIPFDASSKCFEEDLASALEDDNDYNTTLIIKNIVSDIIGIDIAYKAFQSFDQSSENEFDLDYTPNQLFWIKANMMNCYKNVINSNKSDDLEAISRFKAILSVRHSRYFAKDFNCELESTMNPEKKC